MRLLYVLIVSSALLAASALVVAQDDPAARLDAMSRSLRNLDYDGVFTYAQGQALRSYHIVHEVVDGIEHERVTRLDGDAREFHREGHRADCEHEGDRLLRFGSERRQVRDSTTQLAGGADAYYLIEFDGDERVANHPGKRLRIVPRDRYRYGMVIVVDDASSLLLKRETTDGIGRVLERFQFVELRVGGEIPDGVPGAGTGDEVHPLHTGEGPFAWTVAWLPQGFVPGGNATRESGARHAPVELRTYTDGLAVFTIFVERTAEVPSSAGVAFHGATVSYVVPRGNGRLVTVVGEIPVETAQLIANAVNFPDAQ